MIFVCDSQFDVLYNNYHEKFYGRIMSKLTTLLDMEAVRRKNLDKFDTFFLEGDNEMISMDFKTERVLLELFEGFEDDSENLNLEKEAKKENFFHIWKFLDSRSNLHKKRLTKKITHQVKMEKERKKMTNAELTVLFLNL